MVTGQERGHHARWDRDRGVTVLQSVIQQCHRLQGRGEAGSASSFQGEMLQPLRLITALQPHWLAVIYFTVSPAASRSELSSWHIRRHSADQHPPASTAEPENLEAPSVAHTSSCFVFISCLKSSARC